VEQVVIFIQSGAILVLIFALTRLQARNLELVMHIQHLTRR